MREQMLARVVLSGALFARFAVLPQACRGAISSILRDRAPAVGIHNSGSRLAVPAASWKAGGSTPM
jgi:hypothetical protein